MKRLRKILLILFILLGVPAAGIAVITYSHADLTQVPLLESGDLIFQTNLSGQTTAVALASSSLYSHVGVIRKKGSRVSVIHAGGHVIESSLEEFVKSGWGERFTVLRYEGLSAEQREAIVKNTQHYLGRKYNYVFHLESDDIYCSQLPYLAFKQANITLGTMQKISDLNLNNFAVKKLFNERWKMHPSCQKQGMDAGDCWKLVMDEPIITPAGVAEDKHLKQIYSNYWF